jgi:hypothetical protein
MKLTIDTRERLLTSALFLLEMYKIVMGTCLTVFVPHMCTETEVCSLTSSVYRDSLLHQVAMGWNLYSLLTILFMYGMEMYRENWCIRYLDIDESRSTLNLDTEIEEYPQIKHQMATLNQRYKYAVIISVASQTVNIGLSVADLALAWAGISTLTPLLSYVLLLSIKMLTSYNTATSSLKKERAYSAYMRTQKTYNTIDADYKTAKPVSVVP